MRRNTTLSTSILTVFQIRYGRTVMVSLLPSTQAMALISLSVGRGECSVNQHQHQNLQMQRSLDHQHSCHWHQDFNQPWCITSIGINRPTILFAGCWWWRLSWHRWVWEGKRVEGYTLCHWQDKHVEVCHQFLGRNFHTRLCAYHSYLRTSWWQVGNVCPLPLMMESMTMVL